MVKLKRIDNNEIRANAAPRAGRFRLFATRRFYHAFNGRSCAGAGTAVPIAPAAKPLSSLDFTKTPGQSLYSLATAAPPNPQTVFGPDPAALGTPNDPMAGKAIGGIIVFAGGLPLYAADGRIVGGLGLSGDTSCTDYVIAWKVRHELHLDAVHASRQYYSEPLTISRPARDAADSAG